MTTAPTEQVVTVDGQDLRVAVRSGQAGATPLPIINGIGASLELLQPFVDALEPDKSGNVIRFDVPGVGWSPLPSRPYRFSGLCRLIAKMLSALGYGQVDVLGISGRRGRAAIRAVPAVALPPSGARQHGNRCDHGAAQAHCAAADGRTAALRGQRASCQRRPRPVRRISASRARAGKPGYARQQPPRAPSAMPISSRHRLPGRACRSCRGCGSQPSSCPVNDDPIIPLANARMMHRLIRGSRLHIFQGGHLGLVRRGQLSWHQ